MRRDPPDIQTISRLLVIKMSALGDLAKTIPAVDAIRTAYPHLKIGWAVKKGLEDILIGNPSIDELFLVPRDLIGQFRTEGQIRRFRPEVILDMQGLLLSGCMSFLSCAKWRCTWESGREMSGLLTGNPIIRGPQTMNTVECNFGFARVLGIQNMPESAPAYLINDPLINARVDDMLGELQNPVVGMHVGASEANKMWPAEHWSTLADRLIDAGVQVAMFGGKAEVAIAEQIIALMKGQPINLVGKTTPRELAAAIHRCDLFVGGDTGATHIAALVRTPVIALMGATNPVHTGPFGSQHTTIHLGLECSPCFRHPTCNGRFDCMKGIEPLRIFAECMRKLESHRPSDSMPERTRATVLYP